MSGEKNLAESSNLCDEMVAYPPSNVLKDTPRSSTLARIDFRGARGNSFLSFPSLSFQAASSAVSKLTPACSALLFLASNIYC
jgi:hypothetical protein